MTYLAKFKSADMDISVHPFSGISSGTFTFATPSHVGEGVTRSSATQFTLAGGRDYLLFGGISLRRTGTTITYVHVTHQFNDGTANVGKKGSVWLNAGDSSTSSPNVNIQRNPSYRNESVAFIRASDISGSITVTLDRLSVVAGSGTGYDYAVSTATYAPTAAVIIMSIPAV